MFPEVAFCEATFPEVELPTANGGGVAAGVAPDGVAAGGSGVTTDGDEPLANTESVRKIFDAVAATMVNAVKTINLVLAFIHG